MNDLTRIPFTFVAMTHLSFLQTAAQHFEMKDKETFTAARGLEHLRLEEFEAQRISGSTIFSELETVASNLGLETDGTFGGLTSTTGLTQEDAHKIGCACLGEIVTGQKVAERLHARIKELTE